MENEPENKVPEWDRGAVMERAIGKAEESARKAGGGCKDPNPFIAYLKSEILRKYGSIDAFQKAHKVVYGWTASRSCVYSWLRGASMPSGEHRALLQEFFMEWWSVKCAADLHLRADKVKAKIDKLRATILESVSDKTPYEAGLELETKRAKLESSLDHDLLSEYRRGKMRLRLWVLREVIRELGQS